jgi:hypothetical protein
MRSSPFLLWLGLTLGCSSLVAHDAFESSTIMRLQADTIELEVTMAAQTAIALVQGERPAGRLEPEDFPAWRAGLTDSAGLLFDVSVGGKPLPLRKVDVGLTIEADVEFRLLYPRPAAGPVEFVARHVQHLGYGYGSTLSFDFSGAIAPPMKLLMADDIRHKVDLPALIPPEAPSVVATTQARPSQTPVFLPFLRLGVVHILTGSDHLLFLGGLLVVCRGLGPMVGVITCFTLAHSLTLAVAALGLFSLPGRIVEPLIAASIVFIGVENLLRREEPKGRWALTFLFGLIHGFGFAGVLQDIGLGSSGTGIVLPLFSFNLGVELGQLAVATVALPLLLWLRHQPGFVRLGQPAVSMLVVGAGMFWLLQRTLFA